MFEQTTSEFDSFIKLVPPRIFHAWHTWREDLGEDTGNPLAGLSGKNPKVSSLKPKHSWIEVGPHAPGVAFPRSPRERFPRDSRIARINEIQRAHERSTTRAVASNQRIAGQLHSRNIRKRTRENTARAVLEFGLRNLILFRRGLWPIFVSLCVWPSRTNRPCGLVDLARRQANTPHA
jgi:hypothetical protein